MSTNALLMGRALFALPCSKLFGFLDIYMFFWNRIIKIKYFRI
ncbi:hypothetical protein DESC_210006 [Desulfosarcina cetonica]|nr:hypothetical protein DESC_210006 [Desulfosarcina cetonica]